MGDFALPCFSFAKVLHKNPVKIAEELKDAMREVQVELGIEKSEAVNGYLNIFMNRERYVEYWINVVRINHLGDWGIEKIIRKPSVLFCRQRRTQGRPELFWQIWLKALFWMAVVCLVWHVRKKCRNKVTDLKLRGIIWKNGIYKYRKSDVIMR